MLVCPPLWGSFRGHVSQRHNAGADHVLSSPLPHIAAHCFLSPHSIKICHFVRLWVELTRWKRQTHCHRVHTSTWFIKVVTLTQTVWAVHDLGGGGGASSSTTVQPSHRARTCVLTLASCGIIEFMWWSHRPDSLPLLWLLTMTYDEQPVKSARKPVLVTPDLRAGQVFAVLSESESFFLFYFFYFKVNKRSWRIRQCGNLGKMYTHCGRLVRHIHGYSVLL